MPTRDALIRTNRVEVVVCLETGVELNRLFSPYDEVRRRVVFDVVVNQKEARAPTILVKLLLVSDRDVFTL